jgi:hypothetical protein
MSARSILLPVVFLVSALSARAQAVITLIGAPFSATWTGTTDTAGSVTTTKIVVARSSNGSVYRAIYKDGNPDLIEFIEIDDVPHEKQISIRIQMKQYTETPPSPRGEWVTRTTEQQHAILEHWNIAYTRQAANQKKDETPLGVKIVDGMTLYGHHFVRTRDNVRTMEGDTWQSDLGFNYSEHCESLSDKRIIVSTLSEIRRGEPDSSLFIVPSGYTLVPR